ncbi:hypothetical protein NL676_030746 [Syzygium grande]|nr:hypothetical protein NL676_030746 [Syzygium grande]
MMVEVAPSEVRWPILTSMAFSERTNNLNEAPAHEFREHLLNLPTSPPQRRPASRRHEWLVLDHGHFVDTPA